MQVAKTSTYPVTADVYRFPLFVALCDRIHRRYRRTDGRHARSISDMRVACRDTKTTATVY